MLARIRNPDKLVGNLTVAGIRKSGHCIIKHEKNGIRKEEKFPMLQKCLNLFYDEDGVIRVKGRLANSDLEIERKFGLESNLGPNLMLSWLTRLKFGVKIAKWTPFGELRATK